MSFKNLGFIVKVAAIIDWLTIQKTRHRFCDLSYQIHNVDQEDVPTKKYRWIEQLTYDAVEPFSIVGTNNSLGYCSITSERVEDYCIKYKVTSKKQ
jgi:hypothetical protein